MANTLRESTASYRSGDSSDLVGSVPFPSLDYSPRISTAVDPTRQEGSRLTLPIGEPLISCILETVETALELHSITNGATVSIINGSMAGQKLFAVSPYPERTVELTAQPGWQQLFEFVSANVDLLLQPDRALGTWFNDLKGVHVLDVVVCLSDQDAALDLGLRFGQQSIFDLAASREIRIERPSQLPRPTYTEARQ
jgi:hypothetical protein